MTCLIKKRQCTFLFLESLIYLGGVFFVFVFLFFNTILFSFSSFRRRLSNVPSDTAKQLFKKYLISQGKRTLRLHFTVFVRLGLMGLSLMT